MARKPTKKYRRRERREAERHGLTLDQLRARKANPPRTRGD